MTANAGQYEKPWFVVSVQAMYVENVAISPWAKLITPVARWIRHDRECERPVDAAGGESRDDLLEEGGHQ